MGRVHQARNQALEDDPERRRRSGALASNRSGRDRARQREQDAVDDARSDAQGARAGTTKEIRRHISALAGGTADPAAADAESAEAGIAFWRPFTTPQIRRRILRNET